MKFLLFPFVSAVALAATPALAQGEDCTQWRAGAEAGDTDDQLDLAICLFGAAQQADQAEGMGWARKAMAAGDVEAKNAVAVGLVNGIGGTEDLAEGQRLMEEAAAEGSYGAQMSLAEHYINGGGFYEQDASKGLQLLVDAADGGKVKGADRGYVEWRIGMMYLDGIGTTKDSVEAYRWVARGADNGSATAMISRAVMLATGDGVAEDDAAAREWYRKSAALEGEDMFHAMRGLGGMLWYGEGGPVDRAEGCKLLNIAYAGGDEAAEQILGNISGTMTQAEKDSCAAATKEWIEDFVARAE